jgi:hypothetical protein
MQGWYLMPTWGQHVRLWVHRLNMPGRQLHIKCCQAMRSNCCKLVAEAVATL